MNETDDPRTRGDSSSPDRPVTLDDGDDIDAFVDEHALALVEFHTKGCTLCKALEPVLGNVARSAPAAVGTCNPQQDLDLVDAYDIRSVPTVLLFVDGEPVNRVAEGFVGTERLVDLVESHTD